MARENSVRGSEGRNGWIWLAVSLLVIVLDQWTKQIASGALEFQQAVAVFPGFNWTLVYNEGGAFSFLSDHAGWQRWFFLATSSAITLALLVWLKRTPARLWAICLPLSLLVGGALGNLIDRARLGHVIDFIDVYYQSHHWPAFNLADSAITGGIILLIAWEFFGHRGALKTNPEDGRTAR